MTPACRRFLAIAFVAVSFAAHATRQPEALERFRADELRVFSIGAPGCDGLRRASILDPEGYVYRADVGSYLGDAYGRISAIDIDAVTFVELHDVDGRWVEVEKSLRLPASKADAQRESERDAGCEAADTCGCEADAPPVPTPRLAEAQVVEAAARFLERRGRNTDGFFVRRPAFLGDRWLVSYQSLTRREIGGDHFGVSVSDADIDDLEYEGGR